MEGERRHRQPRRFRKFGIWFGVFGTSGNPTQHQQQTLLDPPAVTPHAFRTQHRVILTLHALARHHHIHVVLFSDGHDALVVPQALERHADR